MKTILPSMIVAILAMGATPAFSDEAWQAFECELLDEHTVDDVIDAAEEWLAAARTLPGGKEMGLRILIPHAAASREIDFLFVLSAPSFGRSARPASRWKASPSWSTSSETKWE